MRTVLLPLLLAAVAHAAAPPRPANSRWPEDRFRGGPLTYRPEGKGYLLYSFGMNGKDDGGRTLSNDDLLADDLAIRMPPEPKD
jgi:hypothetical protein